ncbi:MAG: helix-turn-helix transcriptional regulator [Myxococcota bacterium]
MASVTLKELGKRLADLRKRAGLSQAQVAERLGVTNETISRVERGVQWTDFSILAGMAELYSVPWGDLLAVFPEDGNTPRQAAIQEIVEMLRGRPLSDVELVRDMVRVLVRRRTRSG